MDKIAIFGVPRSGTSWLSQIFNSHPDVALRYQPLFSFGHKANLSDNSSTKMIETFFDEILSTKDDFALMATEHQKSYPKFKKSDSPTHIIFKETRYLHVIENILNQCGDVKIIGIVRNPLAVMASWVSAPKEFDSAWDIHSEWRKAGSKNQSRPEEFYGFDKWKEVADAFLRFKSQFPQQFFLVSYDELNNSPLETTIRLFDFCGLEVCEQTQSFLIESKSRHDPDPYSVYRSNANDNRWSDVLPDEISKEIMIELKNSPLESFLMDKFNA